MKPDRVIKLPVFKTMFIPIARKAWKCNLCKERVEIGKRYTHYINRKPHEIISYRFHNECFAMVSAYCEEKHRSTFTPRSVANWIKTKYCEPCGKEGCNIKDCKFIQTAIKYFLYS